MANSNSTPATPPAPLLLRNFKLIVDGYEGYFARCQGPRITVHPIAYREGGAGQHTRWLCGPTEPSQVTLHYGLIVNLQASLFSWFDSAMLGAPTRKNPSILMLDHQGTEKLRYNLFDAFPVAWSAPDFDALGRDVAIESLSLVFERIERVV